MKAGPIWHDYGIKVDADSVAGFGDSFRAGSGVTRLTFTRATPFLVIPISSAARLERSRVRPRTYGPRSLIRTVTDFPVVGLVTSTLEPSGKVLEAAVNS